MTNSIKDFNDLLNSEAYQELARVQLEYRDKLDKEAEELWNSLSYDCQLRAFYAVVKRIYEGEIKEKGTYRHILYDKFNFGPEAYAIGMECGFMYLHNAIFDGEEANK